MKIVATLLVLFFSITAAHAQTCNSPQAWGMSGQSAPDPVTNIVYNPATNSPSGMMGTAALPYIVPLGSYLEITDMIGEKYNVGGTVVYAPFTGTSPPSSNNAFLFSLSTASHAGLWHGSIKLSAGTQFNLLIMDTEPLAGSPGTHQVLGWNLSGRLCATP